MNRPVNPFKGAVFQDLNKIVWVYNGEQWLKVENTCPTCGRPYDKT